MTKQTELAWAAGFFDGEGSSCKPAKHLPNSTRMIISQRERTTLDRFHDAVGVGGVLGPYRDHSAFSGKPYWVWIVSAFDDVQTAALRLWPYLSDPKRAQIVRVGILEEV